MPTEAATPSALDTLSSRELEALLGGAVWYAKYHERIIANEDDGSAAAVARREHFAALHEALRKLGVRLRRPS